MRNTRFHWQRSNYTFQRARRLLFCLWALRGLDGTRTPTSSVEWQWIEKSPHKNTISNIRVGRWWLAAPLYHRANPINSPSNATVATRGRLWDRPRRAGIRRLTGLSTFFETFARPSTSIASRLQILRRDKVPCRAPDNNRFAYAPAC
jgi:hypothetical protein